MAKKPAAPAAPAPDDEPKRYVSFEFPTADDWLVCVENLKTGNDGPLRKVLIHCDWPLRLVPLFATALADEALCREQIAAYEYGEIEKLTTEQTALFRWQAPSVEEAIKAANRSADLAAEISRANARRVQRELAENYLASLHQAFPELFGLEGEAAPLLSSHALPPATSTQFRNVGLDPTQQTWRDCLRAPEENAQQERRRRIVVAGSAIMAPRTRRS